MEARTGGRAAPTRVQCENHDGRKSRMVERNTGMEQGVEHIHQVAGSVR